MKPVRVVFLPPKLKEQMKDFCNHERDLADETSARYECDDPLHPWALFENSKQLFTDWHDFTQQVCVPLVEADGDDEEKIQTAMKLYRKASPYSIAVSLVMALNRIKELEAEK